MRTTVFYISLLAAGLSMTACEDFLTEENPNAIPVTSYFMTENDVERAVNGAYQALRSDYCLGEMAQGLLDGKYQGEVNERGMLGLNRVLTMHGVRINYGEAQLK